MRGNVTGEQYAQVDNQDPFASPVWRSPVYRTPEAIIWIVQLVRLLVRVAWFLIRHPRPYHAAGARPSAGRAMHGPCIGAAGVRAVPETVRRPG